MCCSRLQRVGDNTVFCSVLVTTRCVAVFFRVLQYVAVCCSVFVACVAGALLAQQHSCQQGALQYVAGRCSVLQCAAVCCSVLQCAVGCCSVPQCAAVCCSVLQCAAACCSVLQCAAVCCSVLQCAAVCCSVLQRVAACCSVLQRVAEYCGVLQCVAVVWRNDLMASKVLYMLIYNTSL